MKSLLCRKSCIFFIICFHNPCSISPPTLVQCILNNGGRVERTAQGEGMKQLIQCCRTMLACVLAEVRCGGGSVNCLGSPWNILITGSCWMLGVRFHGEIVPLSQCPGGRGPGHWTLHWSVAILPQKLQGGRGSGIVAPGFPSSVREILKIRNKHTIAELVEL